MSLSNKAMNLSQSMAINRCFIRF